MPKVKISEFSSTPANNTDIDSINIAEGCAPSGINDAIRELMAQLKDFQTGAVGDSFNGPVGTTTAAAGAFTTLAASGAVTLSGGTANGVAYLNGSKVVTSGSALTFDGTLLTVASSTPKIRLSDSGLANDFGIDFYFPSIASSYGQVTLNGSTGGMRFVAGKSGSSGYYQAFELNGSEGMRLTSTGLGIGTSSPSVKLDVRSGATPTAALLDTTAATAYSGGSFFSGANLIIRSGANATGNGSGIRFASSNNGSLEGMFGWVQNASTYGDFVWQGYNGSYTERMRLDSSGNLGLGVTPSAWTTLTAFQNKNSSWYGSGNEGGIYANAYYASGSWRYIATAAATGYDFNATAGQHRWFNAPSGTAGNAITFTQAMTLTADGNLGIGSTSPTNLSNYKTITMNATTGSIIDLQSAGTTLGRIQTDTTYALALWTATATPMVFGTNYTERARIDSSGNLLFAKTTASVTDVGILMLTNGRLLVTSLDQDCLVLNRQSTDGVLAEFRHANTTEGDISISGTTVSYNGGHLSRYAQTKTAKDESLLKGTVLSNLDEMNVYTKDGQPVANEQLNKVKMSDVEGDANVAGVFVNWTHDDAHNVDEINMAMTGDMIIRIAQGTTVVRGDLLMSAGDGTAKPQGDDIVRSKTIAKVTSNHVTCTYADGSYCVPCVLMAC